MASANNANAAAADDPGERRRIRLSTTMIDLAHSSHFCYACNISVFITQDSRLACPRCHGEFVEEINRQSIEEYNAAALREGMIETDDDIIEMTTPRPPVRSGVNSNGSPREDLNIRSALERVFQGAMPHPSEESTSLSGGLPPPSINGAPTQVVVNDAMDYLIQALMENGEGSARPVSQEVIDALKLLNLDEVRKIMENNEHCTICLSEFEIDSHVKSLKCSHNFHSECIDKWLRNCHGNCPVCRCHPATGQVMTRSDGNERSFNELLETGVLNIFVDYPAHGAAVRRRQPGSRGAAPSSSNYAFRSTRRRSHGTGAPLNSSIRTRSRGNAASPNSQDNPSVDGRPGFFNHIANSVTNVVTTLRNAVPGLGDSGTGMTIVRRETSFNGNAGVADVAESGASSMTEDDDWELD